MRIALRMYKSTVGEYHCHVVAEDVGHLDPLPGRRWTNGSATWPDNKHREACWGSARGDTREEALAHGLGLVGQLIKRLGLRSTSTRPDIEINLPLVTPSPPHEHHFVCECGETH